MRKRGVTSGGGVTGGTGGTTGTTVGSSNVIVRGLRAEIASVRVGTVVMIGPLTKLRVQQPRCTVGRTALHL